MSVSEHDVICVSVLHCSTSTLLTLSAGAQDSSGKSLWNCTYL